MNELKKAPFFIKSDTWRIGFGFWDETRGFELYFGRWILCFYDEI